ncbi:HNH endonuclease [Priestia endophytica]|uniref:HNH endonuclease n=1 Tax=Priestia endophytica TaxID=135735 RepID=UPI003D277FE1
MKGRFRSAKEYLVKGQEAVKRVRENIGKIEVPVGVRVADTGMGARMIVPEKRSLKELGQQFAVKSESFGTKGTGKDTLEVKFTKEQLATKPPYSRVPEKWIKKGGTVKIDEDGTWVYTNKKGQTVRYPDGYPDFTEYAHPTVKPVEIEIASPTNRPLDYKNANIKAGLNKDSDPPVASLNEAPEGYTWHHHQDGKTMVLVDKKVHREFTHAGGVSVINGK